MLDPVAVASNQFSSEPSRAIAEVTAENNASLWQMESTRSRAPESGPNRHGPAGRKRTIELESIDFINGSGV